MNNTTSLTKLHHEMIKLRERAEKAEVGLAEAQAELQKLREQEPVAYMDYWKSDGTGIVRKQQSKGFKLYAAPIPTPVPAVPAPSVPEEWREKLSEIALHCTDSDTTDAIDALLQSAEGRCSQTHNEVRHD